ncbi:hypothetical protein GH714_029429 [Hevea brasiliensis]|uniref:Uncharacterized protein n=1 Tax=Hevea brasiliensis TaxID=3981 RepID=A0A6A6LUW2_HEVBR|nr:hypothetical protein GH714_029429 [Hevea brasiliensis]
MTLLLPLSDYASGSFDVLLGDLTSFSGRDGVDVPLNPVGRETDMTLDDSSFSYKDLCPHGLQSSSTITLTGQNRTDLLTPFRSFSLVDGELLLKHDLEKDEAEEQVDVAVQAWISSLHHNC